MIEAGLETFVTSIMSGRNETIMGAMWVRDKSQSKNKLVFLMSESQASLYDVKKKALVMPALMTSAWFAIKEISYSSSTQIVTMRFAQRMFSLNLKAHDVLLNIVMEHLTEIMTPSELPKINCQGMNFDSMSNRPKPVAGLRRLRSKIFIDRAVVPDELNSSFQRFLRGGAEEIDLREFPAGEFLAYVIDALVVQPTIKAIVVPAARDKPQWEMISTFLANAPVLERFETYEGRAGIEALGAGPKWRARVKEFVLSCPVLLSADMKMLTGLCNRQRIESLSILSGMTPEIAPDLFTGLPKCKCLKSLILSNVGSLDLSANFSVLSKMESLAILDSGVDMTSLLNYFAGCRGCKTRRLDLSGSRVDGELMPMWILPPTIDVLVLDRCSFSPKALREMFKGCLCGEKPLDLSLSDMKLPGFWMAHALFEVTRKFLANIDPICMRIKSLRWDGNDVCPYLFGILERCPHFESLSLDGVFAAAMDVTCLVDYIARVQGLKNLSIQRRPNEKMNMSFFESVMGAIQGNISIRCLDISGYVMPMTMVEIVANVILNNKQIEKLNMVGEWLKPMQIDAITTRLKARPTPVKATYAADMLYAKASANKSKVFAGIELNAEQGSLMIHAPPDDVDVNSYYWQWPCTLPVPDIDNSTVMQSMDDCSVASLLQRIRTL